MKLSTRIGVVEFGRDEVRMAVVKTGGKKPVVTAMAAVPLPDAETGEDRFDALVTAAADALAALGNRPPVFVLTADSQYGVVRTLAIPFKGARRVAAAVQFELEPYLAFPIESLVVDHISIRENDGETDVLAVGMRKEPLEEQLAVLQAAGIDPEAISVDAAGLTALWLTGAAPKGLNAVLHVRENGCILTIMQDKTLAFFRNLAVSGEALAANPAAAAREVGNSLRGFMASWKGGGELLSLAVTGVRLGMEESDVFEGSIPCPVSYEDIMERVKMPKDKEDPEGRFSAAVGAALGAAGAGNALNFRRDDLAQQGAWRSALVHAVFTACLAAVLVGAAAVYMYTDYRRKQAEVNEIGEEIWTLYTDAFPGSQGAQGERPPQDIGGVKSLTLMKTEYDDYSGAGGFNVELLERPTLLDILKEISERLPPDKVTITDLVIRPTKSKTQQVTIIGELNDPVAGRQELEKLSESEMLEVSGEPIVSAKPDRTTFTVVATT